MPRHYHTAAALACAVLLAVSAVVVAADPSTTSKPAAASNTKNNKPAAAAAAAVAGVPRKPAPTPQAPTKPITQAVAQQADLSTFAAILKYIGADSSLAAGTDADLIVFAPTNAAFDAFAREMTGDAKATAKDLLQPQYIPLLTHVAASHVTEDDDDNGIFRSFGGQRILVTADANKKTTKAQVLSANPQKASSSASAAILRQQDLGGAGDLYVVDRVLKPDNVFPNASAAVKADPDLAAFGRVVGALAPEVVRSINAGAPATVFAPTTKALSKFLASANVTEAQVLAGSPELKAKVTGILAYHVVPGVGINRATLAGGDAWTLRTALAVVPRVPPAGAKAAASAIRTLRVPKSSGGKPDAPVVVEGDLSKAKVGGQVYAGADVIHKVDNVLVPAVGEDEKKVPAAAAAKTLPAKTPAASSSGRGSSSGRKLLRTARRNNAVANTQRANIRRAMNGSMSVAQATALNNRVAALAPHGNVPTFFLTQAGQRGAWL